MILALSNSKGGVGKSTIAVHLAVWLHEQGRRVILVDSDVQSSSSTWLREAAPEIKSTRLLTAEDVLSQLPLLAAEHDFVIADGPAGLNEVTRALMFVADVAIFPCGPSALDLRAVIDAIEVLKKVRGLRTDKKPGAIIVPNKLQSQYRLSKELMQTVRNFGMPAGDGLSLRQAYADAAGQGTVVWRMNSSSARDASAEMQFLLQQLSNYEPTANPKNAQRGDHRAEASA